MPRAGYIRYDPGPDRRSIDCAITSLCSLLSFGFGCCDRGITCQSFRDLAITAFSATIISDGNLTPRGPGCGPEHQPDAVVINQAPAAGFLQRAAQRRVGGH